MKNIFDLLQQKENEYDQLQREVAALRLAAELLADDAEETAPELLEVAEFVSPVAATDVVPALAAPPIRRAGAPRRAATAGV